MSRQTRRPWREWLPTGLSDGGKKKAGRSRSAGRRLARLEYLEDRRLLSFEPTAQAQELLFHMNRMRVDPQGELDVLFSSIDPLVARDPGANAAIKYFNDPTTVEILSEWQSLSPTAPLAWNESLHNAATAHSLLMKQQDTQSHQLSGEDPLGTRITNAGYTNWSGVAENIFAYAESPFHAHCAFVIDWGVASRGHRENIMDPFYREVGIGIAEDTSSSTSVGPLLVTQDFGNRYGLSQAFMVGAAFADADGDASYDVGEGLSEVQVTATGAAGTFTTTTMSAGGWQLQLPAGDYTVTAAGGTFAGTGRVAVHVGSDNVEVDFLSGLGTGYVNFDLWEITAEPLGTVDFLEMPGVHPDAEPLWYQFQAAYSGLLTVDATYDSLGGSAQLVLYDSAGAELDRSAADGGYQRVDATVTAGETYLLEVSGTSPTVDLRLVNLVERNGSSVSVHGTAEADSLVFDAADGPNLSIRGLSYDFGGGQVTVFSFDGTGGNDDVRVIGGTGADQATLHPTSGTFTGQGYSLSVVNIESIDYDGGEGADTVTLWGSTGANIYTADPGRGEMTGDGVSISVTAETIYARGNGGSDTVYFTDSEGDDLLQYFPRWATMSGEGYFNQVNAFKVMYADAERGAGGTDTVIFRGTSANDQLRVTEKYARFLSGTGAVWHTARGFDTILGYGRGGRMNDMLVLFDTPGVDALRLGRLEAEFTAPGYVDDNGLFKPGYTVETHGFGTVEATRLNDNGSADRVAFSDSKWDDTLVGNPEVTTMSGPDYINTVTGFPSVRAYSQGLGYDTAYLSDHAGASDGRVENDTFTGNPLVAQLSGPDYLLWTRVFDEVHAEAKGGHDVANLNSNANADLLSGSDTEVSLSGTNSVESFARYAKNFDEVTAEAGGGDDRAVLTDALVDGATYGQPAAPPLEQMVQALWLNNFEQIELRTSASGATSEINGVDAVFACWL